MRKKRSKNFPWWIHFLKCYLSFLPIYVWILYESSFCLSPRSLFCQILIGQLMWQIWTNETWQMTKQNKTKKLVKKETLIKTKGQTTFSWHEVRRKRLEKNEVFDKKNENNKSDDNGRSNKVSRHRMSWWKGWKIQGDSHHPHHPISPFTQKLTELLQNSRTVE